MKIAGFATAATLALILTGANAGHALEGDNRGFDQGPGQSRKGSITETNVAQPTPSTDNQGFDQGPGQSRRGTVTIVDPKSTEEPAKSDIFPCCTVTEKSK